MTPQETSSTPAQAPVTAAVCGLCCDACSIFIGSHEEPKRLEMFAARMGWDLEDAYCDGCRSERRTPYCQACELYKCAEQRGYAFCSECEDYPCADLQTFQKERPHRIELFEDLARIGEIGAEAWLAEAKERHSCPACGTLNSAYDLKCRKCGHEPGSAYAAAHRDAVLEALTNR
ncbi:MAG: DUF3795 domain-containing protein [Thermoleophilia bacterium]|nr:DUF3795 domain-containing protein [Thermoleophilia bacterium]